jgi:hypothetical protein
MRRLVLALAIVVPAALLAPAASATRDLPCDHWVHGCDVAAYVYDACRAQHIDCGIV